MNYSPTRIIERKRDGLELSPEEIQSFVTGVVDGSFTEYQASAFLMAVFFQGMTLKETVALTLAMRDSGEVFNFSNVVGVKSDKHSTGGVGDKVSLILAPLAAACGLKIPMMSGRGLAHSGGTLDKLESIPGFHVRLSESQVKSALEKFGVAMLGQTEKIAPADRKLYALRDVTGTVECIPLIVASILSKKLAEGTDNLVLDVKVGSGAFMKTPSAARKLAQTLLRVSKGCGLPCRALVTDMSQPLGYSVGNQLELIEAIEVLSGKKIISSEIGSGDLKELTLQLCAHMLELSKVCKNMSEGRRLALKHLEDGSAWKIFQKIIENQDGDLSYILNPKQFPSSKYQVEWRSPKKGYISQIQTDEIGKIVTDMGGGRRKVTDTIDPTVGFVFHKKLGSRVEIGDPIVTAHISTKQNAEALEGRFFNAISITPMRKSAPKLVLFQEKEKK